jgi:hypothetical protein
MKAPKTPAVPQVDLYALLSKPDKKYANRKIIISPDGTFTVLKDSETKVPIDVLIDTEFKNFDDLMAKGKNTILAYHEQFFKAEPPKKQSIMDTALWVWAYLIKNCKPRLEDKTADGEAVRKSSILGRKYFRGESPDGSGALATPQAVTCCNIFFDALKKAAEDKRDYVTEDELRSEIIRRQEEIKTRQDPWRIFQYYRPKMIEKKLLKHD